MDNFRRSFLEPYYRGYYSADLDTRLAAAGFTSIEVACHTMAWVWSATKAR